MLDSCGASPHGGRYLIAGFDPAETVEAYVDETVVRARGSEVVSAARAEVADLLDRGLALRAAHEAPGLPASGACIASFAYELVRQLDGPRRARSRAREVEDREPVAFLSYFDALVIHDYASGRTRVVSSSRAERCDEVVETLLGVAVGDDAKDDTPDDGGPGGGARVTSNFTRDEYVSAVGRIKEHIYAGDIYQANLTQRIACALAPGLGPEEIFLRLRREHPAPFAAFLRRPRDTVVSASPERFLRVSGAAEGGGRLVESWPIKGTRRRGHTPAEDASLRAELLSSAKDRAENTMIVDLMRNDLGRVCRYGTVSVPELCALQEHPTLFHLVSKVRGLLREGVTPGGLLRAAFPCGSITGAPKIRAMEIIDEVEPCARGLSMGAVGYFSFDGRLDLSVAIRTMTVREGVARFNVGGGVVADSDPAAEYDESLLKARALLRALGAQGN